MKTHVLGVPRIGQQCELKFALEAFWSGQSSESELLAVARDLRAKHQSIQSQAGLDFVAVGDFSLYDQMLDMSVTLGALPERFGFDAHALSLTDYFSLARGNETQPAMEMTKWFNTNYHYLVPELSVNQTFSCQPERLIGEINEAIGWGRTAKPVIIGPLTYLYLSKITEGQSPESACDCDGHTTLKHTQNDEDKLALLPALLNAYTELLQHIEQRGVSWVQMDEPILALDLPDIWLNAFGYAYQALSKTPLKLLLATYFDSVSDHAELLARLPVSGIHIDVCAAPEQLETILQHHPRGRVLSVGVINGRNVWRADLGSLHAQLKPVYERLKHDLWLGSSCSLLHAPMDLRSENLLDSELHRRLSFAWQKIDEIVALKKSLTGHTALTSPLNRPKANEEIAQRIAKLSPADAKRRSPHNIRAEKQQEHLKLPLFPTTTIGSFPQTIEIRRARAAHKKGELPTPAYKQLMQSEIAQVIHEQEKLGLDVLVHGEAERNDMVEYFGEHLTGYAFTQHGWVQSYGSRCVKPPIIHADVARAHPITVEWARYASSLTDKPVKGMLTGPITMLQWSFVREDQPRSTTALQIALALRDEVSDLETAGVTVIQMDEPALREGLPLKSRDWKQ